MSHPYEKYKGSNCWRLVEKAIGDLVKNEDIKETTARDYIVGYICKTLSKSSGRQQNKSKKAKLSANQK